MEKFGSGINIPDPQHLPEINPNEIQNHPISSSSRSETNSGTLTSTHNFLKELKPSFF
jgi:hypothetical protein